MLLKQINNALLYNNFYSIKQCKYMFYLLIFTSYEEGITILTTWLKKMNFRAVKLPA